MTTNHPAHGPVSLDRLHQISEILSKAAAQSDGGNLGYAMADAVKVIDGAIAAFGVDNKTTHNSVIAEQLAHILSVMEVTDHQRAIISCAVDRLNKNADTICQLSKAACALPDSLDYHGAKELFNYLMTEEETNATVNGWNACRAAMLQAGNSPVTPDGWQLVPKEPTAAMNKAGWDAMNEHDAINPTYRAMLAAAPKQEVKAALEHGMQRYASAMQKLSEGDK
ncbi:hypothetical protein B9P82_27100 [Citrobacter sp. L55]|uniref:hypothetical protein n=1 Tax=Citrobacter sp. L55 TaxID=1981983 RepID=UPI000C7896B8|nr:hypothetical protein [Citrobacter sp. L55]PLC60065.1 hypothetical protein B9P82_27100 [Citrobacter sp. L55]